MLNYISLYDVVRITMYASPKKTDHRTFFVIENEIYAFNIIKIGN